MPWRAAAPCAPVHTVARAHNQRWPRRAIVQGSSRMAAYVPLVHVAARDARALGSRALTTRVGRFPAPTDQIGHFGPNRDRPPPWTSPMYPCHRSMALGRMVGGSNALY